jgi:hypothetical protein
VLQVAALPTSGTKLVVGNTFIAANNIQWYGNTMRGVHADNAVRASNVLYDRTFAYGYGSPLALFGLCYKGAPGQLFFAEVT